MESSCRLLAGHPEHPEILITAFTLFMIGGVSWTVAYASAICVGLRQRTYAIPAVAVVLNFSWETLYAAHYMMNSGGPRSIVDSSWALLDAGILYTLLRYGKGELRGQVQQRWVSALCLGSFALAYILHAGVIAQFGWSQGARYSAFIQNVVISALFVSMFVSRRGSRGQSLVIAIGKAVGTLCLTVDFGVLEGSPLALTAGAVSACLNAAYIALLASPRLTQWLCQETVAKSQ